MKLRFLGLLALTAVGSAQADTFRYEVDGSVGQGTVSGLSEDVDFDLTVLGGTFYLAPVNTDKGPLAEAAFLDRASSVSAAFGTVDVDDGLDSDVTLVSTRIVAGPYIFELNGVRSDDDISGTTDTLSFGVGTYIDENSQVLVHYTDDVDGEIDTVGASYRSVFDTGVVWAVDLGLSYIDADFDDGYSALAGATWYPANNIGVGASVDYTSLGDDDAQEYGIFGEYFFTTNVAGRVEYGLSEDGDLDTDFFAVSVRARF